MKKTFVLTLFILLFSEVIGCKARQDSQILGTQEKLNFAPIQTNQDYTISKTYQSRQIIQPITGKVLNALPLPKPNNTIPTDYQQIDRPQRLQLNSYFATRRKDNVNVLRYEVFIDGKNDQFDSLRKIEFFEIEEEDLKTLNKNKEFSRVKFTPFEKSEQTGHIQFQKHFIDYRVEGKKLILLNSIEYFTHQITLPEENPETIKQKASLLLKTTKSLEMTYNRNVLLGFGIPEFNVTPLINIFDEYNLLTQLSYKLNTQKQNQSIEPQQITTTSKSTSIYKK